MSRLKMDRNREFYFMHCCEQMEIELISTFQLLNYSAKVREYSFAIPNSSTCMLLDYCVFCGMHLPDSLRYEWFWFLEYVYKIDGSLDEDNQNIPKDFLTDEWWKSRNLTDEAVRDEIRMAMLKDDSDEWHEKIKREQVRKKNILNYNGPHCCLTMDAGISRGFGILYYIPQLREYQIQSVGFLVLDFCPFCGKKEPQSLRKKWLEILKEDYGLVDPLKKDQKKVPQEFLTDEWWRERGL